MVNGLKVPETPPGAGIQSKQAIGKEVISFAVSTIKISRRRTRWREDDAVFGIDRVSRPRIDTGAIFPSSLRPGRVAEFIGLRHGVKAPHFTAGAHIEGAHIAGRTGLPFRSQDRNNRQVFKDRRRRSTSIGGFG